MMVLTNSIFLLCFSLLSVVEFSAWKSKFNNSSDPAVEVQFNRIQTSTRICLLVNYSVPILLILGICGPRGLLYILRRMIRPHILLIFSLGLNLFLTFVLIICPSKEAQTLVTTIFMVSFSHSTSHRWSSCLAKNDYSVSHVPNAIFILETISSRCAGQHLAHIFLLNRSKPPHFCLSELDNEERKNPEETSVQPERDASDRLEVVCVLYISSSTAK